MNLFAAEWLKIRTLRSFWICSVLGMVLGVAGAVLQGLAFSDPDLAKGVTARDALTDVLGSGSAVLQIAIVVLSVLVLSSEYSGGAIRVTFVATPWRLRVMAAKALVVTAIATVLASLSLTLGYAAAVPFLHQGDVAGTSLGIMLSLLGVEIGYCVLVALFAFAVTLAVRNTAAAVTITLGVVLLSTVVLTLLDLMLRTDLTSVSFSVVASGVLTDPLSRALPAVVAWLAVPAVLGGLALTRRDA
ncbi:ABC transporter permease subunit [Actinoplanes derwentensis]|uniref:ABC-2 type transport system permease protein n=1 Tax=Actinoplanes derwentensis TaxID=113562 RepID=A0A1H1RVS8_9ACTN|nr:ABC transporter permease subunit [Actinoplanes derwentensis]GID84535.1 hypothetical protein Ade03nite_34590 [Actinoplanes derwentensis]SDS39814.1 ABC-2 type transport system permease protein [Actinoplanes derwentensis]